MSTGQNQSPGIDADKKKWLTILVPAAGVAFLVVLVAVMAGIGGSGGKMSDGSDGSADDPGLKEISPGVKYRDVKEGQGEPAPKGGKVKINYTGWLTDGTVFDSTKDKTPATFDLDGLIKGWQEGIPGMKPGGIRKLVISPDKGYGAKASGKILANSTLIFEVELLQATAPQVMELKADTKTLSDGTSPTAEDKGLKDLGEGLKIRDLKEGTGPVATDESQVEVYYTGWLTDGTVFDSSAQRRETITFGLNGVIEGWKKGIPGMKVGGVRKLVVPAALGYGARAQGKIPPNSTLIFEVQLVGIK
jgi:peptidylprolyl isomerase